MGNDWWRNTFNTYNFHDPSNEYYARGPVTGLNSPQVIESNKNISIQLSRHCNGVCTYDVATTARSEPDLRVQRQIDECSDQTGAPYICARSYLGSKSRVAGSVKYDRTG
jgi:hypothetical protein